MKNFYLSACAVMAAFAMNAQAVLTLNVDMNGQTVSANGVHVAGNFYDNNYDGTADNAAYMSGSTQDGNWDPAVDALSLTDGDADGVYSIALSLAAGRYEFKLINGNSWGEAEDVPPTCQVEVNGNDNRQMMIENTDITWNFCFAQCVACGESAVRFRIDMSTQPAVSPNGVHVAGNFQNPNGDDGDWTAGANPLQDWNNDNVWEGIYSIGSMTSFAYKFINGNDWSNPNENVSGPCGDGTGNRLANITETNTVLPSVCYASCDPCTQPVSVTFNVDMTSSCADVSQGVNLMGTATDWGTGAPMTDMGGGVWSITLNLSAGSYAYKFRTATGTWEGIGDRPLTVVAETPQELPVVCFGSNDPCPAVIAPGNVTISVKAPETGVPSGQYMWVMGDFTNPSWQSGAVQMTDADADGTWEANFPAFCQQSAFFKFVIGADNTNTGTDWLEESADFSALPGSCGVDNGTFSDNRQFIRTSSNDTSFCYIFNTCDACVVNVEESDFVSNVNVYPVPAEDMLTLTFNAAIAQRIQVRLINSLGQEVVNENLGTVSGNRVANINVAQLAKGIYTLDISNGLSHQTTLVAVK